MITVIQDDETKNEGSKTNYPSMSAVSDGYHTFRELYEFRMLLQAILFNEWALHDLAAVKLVGGKPVFDVHKSWRHNDGELCFGKENYFVVVATLPTGQITNHYKGYFWELFKIPARERAEKWDGHTAQDAATRLRAYLEQRD